MFAPSCGSRVASSLPEPEMMSLAADFMSSWKCGVPCMRRYPKQLDGGQKVRHVHLKFGAPVWDYRVGFRVPKP